MIFICKLTIPLIHDNYNPLFQVRGGGGGGEGVQE